MATKQAYAWRAEVDKRICQNQVERFDQINEKISSYKNERNALPQDSDGIYIIVGGQASIFNQFDKHDYGGFNLQVGDYFGTSKYLLSQGFAYFGDIIAHKEQSQKTETR